MAPRPLDPEKRAIAISVMAAGGGYERASEASGLGMRQVWSLAYIERRRQSRRAEKLLRNGSSVEEVVADTGLPLKRVEKLKKRCRLRSVRRPIPDYVQYLPEIKDEPLLVFDEPWRCPGCRSLITLTYCPKCRCDNQRKSALEPMGMPA